MHSHIILIILCTSCIVIHECNGERSFLSMTSQTKEKVSKECSSDIKILHDNLQKLTPWAVEMWESSAREATALLKGCKYQLGDFDKCLPSDTSIFELPRQYCLVTLALDQKYTSDAINYVLKRGNGSVWAVCSPASCTKDELALMLQDYPYFGTFFGGFNLTHRVINVECRIHESAARFSVGSIAFICCFVGLIILVLWATNRHLDSERKGKNDCPKIIRGLSIMNNWRDLTRKDDELLMFFHGLRVVASLAVILSHFVSLEFTGAMANKNDARLMIKDSLIERFTEGVGCFVDVFFVIGGFFAMIGISKNFQNKNKLEMAFFRYIRIMPSYGLMLALLMATFTGRKLGSLWHLNELEYFNCLKNWWTNVLLINNYANFGESCLTHTWYIACDFHFYLMTIALCYYLAVPSREKLGLRITGALLVLSALINGFIVVSILVFLCAIACFYMNLLYAISFDDSPYDLVSSTIYGAVHRLIVGLSIATIILVCIFGNLPLITPLLGCTPMMVLGRLTYGAYLVSFPFQGMEVQTGHAHLFTSTRTPLVFLGSTAIIFLLSLFMHLFVEKPFINLYKTYMSKGNLNFDKKDK